MDKKRPLGVTMIGYFYVWGAIALMISLFINAKQQFGISVRFGVPNVPENAMRVLVVAISLLMAYGYLRLKKWGYWVMITYTIYFLVISICLSHQYNQQLFYGNVIFSILVLKYTLSKRNYFNEIKFSL